MLPPMSLGNIMINVCLVLIYMYLNLFYCDSEYRILTSTCCMYKLLSIHYSTNWGGGTQWFDWEIMTIPFPTSHIILSHNHLHVPDTIPICMIQCMQSHIIMNWLLRSGSYLFRICLTYLLFWNESL